VYGKNNAVVQTQLHQYAYDALGDEAQLSSDTLTLAAYNKKTTGNSHRTYDVNGLLSQSVDAKVDDKGKNHSTNYWMSALDGLRAREDSTGVTSYLSINGNTIGDLQIKDGKSQTLSVYGGFTPSGGAAPVATRHGLSRRVGDFIAQAAASNAAPEAPQDSLGSYTARAGETLEQVAMAVFGDKSLWYIVADANGVSNKTEGLDSGRRLIIPSLSSNQHQTSQSRHVMSGQSLYGDTSPTAHMPAPPPPPKHHHSFLKALATAVVAVVATVLTAGVLAGIAGVSGALLSAGSSALAGSAGLGLFSSAAIGFTAGVAGNIASQGMQNAFGMQHGVNLKSALISGLTSAASIGAMQGLNKLPAFSQAGSALNEMSPDFFSMNTAAAMMEQDAIAQGLRLGVEKHHHFDFAELAASGAIGGVARSKAGQKAQQNVTQQLGNQLGTGASKTLKSISQSALQSGLAGSHFDASSVVANSLGDAVGNGFVNGLAAGAEEAEQTHAQAKIKAENEQHAAFIKAKQGIDGLYDYGQREFDELSSDFDEWLSGRRDVANAAAAIRDLYDYGQDAYNELKTGINSWLNEHYEVAGYAEAAVTVGKGVFELSRGIQKDISSSWEMTKERGFGALQLAGGVAQLGIAASISELSLGTLGVIGAGIAAHGADDIVAGWRRTAGGNYGHNMTETALMAMGVSEGTAGMIDAVAGVGGVFKEAQLVSKGYRAMSASSAAARSLNEVDLVEGVSKKSKLAPSEFARSLQGNGLYPGKDVYRDITLGKGKIIYGGAPGQSEFYTTKSTLENKGQVYL